MLKRTDAVTNEVLEPITFVLAYPTVIVSLFPISSPFITAPQDYRPSSCSCTTINNNNSCLCPCSSSVQTACHCGARV